MARLNRRHRLLIRWGAISVAVLAGAGGWALWRAAGPPPPSTLDANVEGLTSVLDRNLPDDLPWITFVESAAGAGITFRHFPFVRSSLLPEDNGSGLAWGDYDDDGDPDLYLVNVAAPYGTPPENPEACNRLYRNDSDGTFTDVTREAGVGWLGIGNSAAWGDFDDDGDLDLYVTNVGANVLYANQGDGTFRDVTAAAGVGDDGYSAGCAWGDFDRDGDLDLYVCNYVRFELRLGDRRRHARQYDSEVPYTLNPSSYAPVANRLFRNDGDGTFVDVAESAGVADPHGRSLGALWCDFDKDGRPDLYVANDVSANGVFRNQGDGTFEDIGAGSLAADYRGAMGLAAADPDGDDDLDLFITHWLAQENALYENMWPTRDEALPPDHSPRLFFMDVADMHGLGQISLDMVGWGTGFADFDNDGNLDLWVVNGNTLEVPEDHTQLVSQPFLLFVHRPRAGWFDIARRACPVLAEPFVGRGGAQADYDGDGRLDVAILVHGGAPLLLRNVTENGNHWLGVRLRQTGRNTRAIGARVTVQVGDRRQTAEVGGGGSYLSQHQLDLFFGLGAATQADRVEIRWPDGADETFTNVPAEQIVRYDHAPEYGRQP